MSLRAALLYAALLAAATGLALTTRLSTGPGADVATVGASHGGGLAALATWLREAGHDVRTLRTPLTTLPPDLRTLVVAAPSAQRVTAAERDALRAFVNGGGRLVYLRGRFPQPDLDGWLDLADGAELHPAVEATDLGGTTAQVMIPRGLLAGIDGFRVSARRGLSSGDAHFLPVASVQGVPVLLWRTEGRGEIFAAGNADLAENRRLELAGNRVMWARMAAEGPLAFDEFHHEPPGPAPLPVAPWLFGAQVVLCAVVLALTRGTPLGPPRPGEPEPLPGASRYALSFGRLLRRARVEAELVDSLETRLRTVLAERSGVPLSVQARGVAELLGRRQPELAGEWEAWRAARNDAPQRLTPEDYLELTRLAARVESCARGITGRA